MPCNHPHQSCQDCGCQEKQSSQCVPQYQACGTTILYQPRCDTVPLVRVRVLKWCPGGQWSRAEELSIHYPPQVGTSLNLSDGPYYVDSLLLVSSDPSGSCYEARVYPASMRGGCESSCYTDPCKPKAVEYCRVMEPEPACSYSQECPPINHCSPCNNTPQPSYGLRGYPW